MIVAFPDHTHFFYRVNACVEVTECVCMYTYLQKASESCADPESFVRGGPILTFFLVEEERKDPKYHY